MPCLLSLHMRLVETTYLLHPISLLPVVDERHDDLPSGHPFITQLTGPWKQSGDDSHAHVQLG